MYEWVLIGSSGFIMFKMRFNSFYVAFFLFAGCSSNADKKANQDLKINLVQEPSSLDPLFCRNLSSLFLARHLHEGLFRYVDEEVKEALCSHYEVLDNDQTFRFYLKQAHYNDGSLIKAQDFLEAALKVLDPNIHSDYAHLLYVIKEAKKFKQTPSETTALGIKVISDDCIEYRLEYPHKEFPALLTHPIFFPVKKGCFSGPFAMKTIKHGDCIELVKNVFYHDKNDVHLDKITGYFINNDTACVMYQKKKLDFIGSPLGAIPQEALSLFKKEYQLEIKPLLGTCFLRLNTQKAPLDNVSLRQTIRHSISKKQIEEGGLLSYHTSTETLVPALFNLGTKVNKSQSPISSIAKHQINLKYSVADSRQQKIALIIKHNLENAIGITINLIPKESKSLLQDLQSQDYDMMIGSWLADVKGAENFLDLFKEKSSSINGTGWENQNYKNLLFKASQDPLGKLNYFKEAEQVLLEDCPIIPLFQFNMIYAKDKKLEGFSLNSLGILDFKNATLRAY